MSLRVLAWHERRRAAVLYSDEKRMIDALRPYFVGGSSLHVHTEMHPIEAAEERNERRGIVSGKHATDFQVPQCGSSDFDRLLSVAIEFASHSL